MSLRDCINEIMNSAGLDKDTAEGLLDKLDAAASRLQAERGLSRDEALAQATTDMANQIQAAASVQQRNQLMNLQKRVSRRARIVETAETLGGDQPDFVGAVRNQMVALNTPVRGGRLSAEAEALTRHDQYLSGLTNELDRKGLYQAARSNQFQREWGRELYELSLQNAGDDRAQPGVTKNQHAIEIAQSVSKYMAVAKDNLNKAGAWIGEYAGYINRTVHDEDKIRRAGQDSWTSFIRPLLDDKTFEGADSEGEFLRGVYNALYTGVHLSDADGVGFKDPAFTGPANLAKKLSESRVLHFKDADGWMDYQEKFGRGTLLEQVYGSLGRAAHSQSLLSRWGTNPEAEFKQDMQWLGERYRDQHTDSIAALNQGKGGLENLFSHLTGEANRPQSRLAAKIASYVRLDESMAKLGMVAFTHLSAATTKAGELHYQGVPWHEAYGNFLSSIFRGMSHGDAAQWADETLAGLEGTNRDIISAFSPNDSVPGKASRLANLFFKLSGLTWLLNKQKAGAEWAISRRAGMMMDRAHDDLPPEMQRALMQYDISPKEWDVLRNAPDHVSVNGRQFLTPQAAIRASDESYHPTIDMGADTNLTERSQAFIDRRVAAGRENLSMKVHAWLHDTADRSVVTPGIQDHALLLRGTQPGTIPGEALRFVSQFKMWPIAAVRQQWGREIYGQGGVGNKIGGILNLTVGSALTGYGIYALKMLMKGQNPPPPSPQAAIAGMMQGGGLGIFGDYLFGEYSRFGQSVTESALGPVLGSGSTAIFDLWNRIKSRAEGSEHPQPLAPAALKLLTDNTPFINMFYTRQALNYLFLHSLQETLNPGYLERSQRSLKQKQGATYWLSPSEHHLHTFGR